MNSRYIFYRLAQGEDVTDRFQDTSLFPLRDTIFEGVPAKIPYRYADLLREEYGEKSLIPPTIGFDYLCVFRLDKYS